MSGSQLGSAQDETLRGPQHQQPGLPQAPKFNPEAQYFNPQRRHVPNPPQAYYSNPGAQFDPIQGHYPSLPEAPYPYPSLPYPPPAQHYLPGPYGAYYHSPGLFHPADNGMFNASQPSPTYQQQLSPPSPVAPQMVRCSHHCPYCDEDECCLGCGIPSARRPWPGHDHRTPAKDVDLSRQRGSGRDRNRGPGTHQNQGSGTHRISRDSSISEWNPANGMRSGGDADDGRPPPTEDEGGVIKRKSKRRILRREHSSEGPHWDECKWWRRCIMSERNEMGLTPSTRREVDKALNALRADLRAEVRRKARARKGLNASTSTEESARVENAVEGRALQEEGTNAMPEVDSKLQDGDDVKPKDEDDMRTMNEDDIKAEQKRTKRAEEQKRRRARQTMEKRRQALGEGRDKEDVTQDASSRNDSQELAPQMEHDMGLDPLALLSPEQIQRGQEQATQWEAQIAASEDPEAERRKIEQDLTQRMRMAERQDPARLRAVWEAERPGIKKTRVELEIARLVREKEEQERKIGSVRGEKSSKGGGKGKVKG
ncbi:hypothetical protein EK21DRAFT_113369 [Setomelanomma holmii]|uniref:Uncharacterized protein n=1 Tax=Setomelanomma holmii TaxID=210430 RepID=A0A9P4H6D1_9PLEO|nr:hypothetical protein EK21DRAFT_113369 [Setomelanomma holmii]